ncbi:Gfo/Idh/MocA family protein [Pelagibacterium sediminicola]|uniref:Gfo/Idh/MocA family protein n=1 Tax=Pelagibacterium sediminicola TaxID=2248761 RepID=UPI000E31F696|nr:Gfo/Idh/MocA family oxidoreductase [Pelagibacterium sediminicola]
MKLALAGIGKIALDQHIPALAASKDWELAATVSRNASVEGVPAFSDLSELLAQRPDIEAVSLAMPPAPRYDYARAVLEAGRHAMLEKPPGATLAEVHALERHARQKGLTLFATWHSRMARGVAAARDWLAGKTVLSGKIVWREDVRHWHPGQDWVFEPGGMGVFDPGINALSILTEILPAPVHLASAELDVPANRQTPIAARLRFSGGITADFDWRQEGPQTWDITLETDAGRLVLGMGGNVLEIDGRAIESEETLSGEYPALYVRMAELVRARKSDVDLSPMVHVADAMMLARRNAVEPFFWDTQR